MTKVINKMNEIESLQAKIKELQQLKEEKEKEEVLKITSLEHNVSIINEIYQQKKDTLEKNRYSSRCIVAKFQDEKLVPFMEAVMNSLNNINDRLKKLEEGYIVG